MDGPYECPEELRDAVQERYKRGPGPKLAHLIKIGMRTAIQEMRDNQTESNLTYDPLAGQPKAEIDALQAIYQYLDAKGMKWTLGCLVQESTVEQSNSSFDLLALANEQPEPIEARDAQSHALTEEEE
jgi:hypothetical protein